MGLVSAESWIQIRALLRQPGDPLPAQVLKPLGICYGTLKMGDNCQY